MVKVYFVDEFELGTVDYSPIHDKKVVLLEDYDLLQSKLDKAVSATNGIKACIEQHNFDTESGILGDYFKIIAEIGKG